jgi:hypothetical protein
MSMAKKLNEAKADLDLAVVKALVSSKLRLEELQELLIAGDSHLMVEYELTSGQCVRVQSWAQSELQRMAYQDQQTGVEGIEDLKTGTFTKTHPLRERQGKRQIVTNEKQIRNIVKSKLQENDRSTLMEATAQALVKLGPGGLDSIKKWARDPKNRGPLSRWLKSKK